LRSELMDVGGLTPLSSLMIGQRAGKPQIDLGAA
jgi:hypothetical protein